MKAFAQPKPNERGLLYFTGHGSAGGNQYRPDYNNTTYALWGDDDISEREVGSAIANWPAQNPLFVVAVQCHSGGFANLIFQDSDPEKPLLNRDIAGFFLFDGPAHGGGLHLRSQRARLSGFHHAFFRRAVGRFARWPRH